MSEAIPSATQFSKGLTKLAIFLDYKRPGILCLALPSFASLSQSAKIGLSRLIFYVKNHPNLSDFFFHQE